MKKVTIKLVDGRKVVRKIEVTTGNEEVLYDQLQMAIIKSLSNGTKVQEHPQLEEEQKVSEKTTQTPEKKVYVNDTDKNKSLSNPLTVSIAEALNKQFGVKEEKPKVLTSEGDRGVFLVMKCPSCGKQKYFTSRTGKNFICDCGKCYKIENVIPIKGECTKCGNQIGHLTKDNIGTLEGMDVSSAMKCNKCNEEIHMTLDETNRIWNVDK